MAVLPSKIYITILLSQTCVLVLADHDHDHEHGHQEVDHFIQLQYREEHHHHESQDNVEESVEEDVERNVDGNVEENVGESIERHQEPDSEQNNEGQEYIQEGHQHRDHNIEENIQGSDQYAEQENQENIQENDDSNQHSNEYHNHENGDEANLKSEDNSWDQHQSGKWTEEEHLAYHMKQVPYVGGRDINSEEKQYHLFASHDYDQDMNLDGIEIIQALYHIAMDGEYYTDQELGNHVDYLMDTYDLNKDGRLSYPEYIMSVRKGGKISVLPEL